MTRKQALHIAIQVLSDYPEHSETIQLLKDLSDELPLIHWTDKSIRDTVDQFILDNNRVPTATDFRKGGMPPHTVIHRRYGITLSEWLSLNYPTNNQSFEEKKNRYTKNFIEDYVNIKPRSAEEFNAKRRKNTLGWQSMVRYHDVTTWRELLSVLNLYPYGDDPKIRTSNQISVTVCSDYDFSE